MTRPVLARAISTLPDQRLRLELAVFFGAVAALDFAGLRRAARRLPVIMVGCQVLAASPARSPAWRRSTPRHLGPLQPRRTRHTTHTGITTPLRDQGHPTDFTLGTRRTRAAAR
ncbi:hypothetical protein G5C60_22665 [Streptomyces sp. HC44]|uniref:Uncharacterized protein n=1 Tax=Streptomyces scabichelini TaxID=2711217 RepID=A0A6G4V914_9ACTN|nr:hypothetical protein [Streptomyces scabichelini]NGO10317.1 hypothetical protein [Streptomyces scabichelini]